MKALLWSLLAAFGLYGCLLVLMYVGQRALMYFPETARTSPGEAGLAQAEEVALDTADGVRALAWHIPPRGEQPVVLYFHGNGGALRYRAVRFQSLAADGYGVVAVSYRGYGGSAGSPSEAGLIEDARSAYRFAAARYGASRLVPWGESLGSAVAVAIAAESPVRGVILEAPFTSAVDVGQRTYWFAPVHLLIRDSWHSDWRIGRVSAPTLVLHGERDMVVPIVLGERLYELIRAPKHFARFAGGGHVDLDAHGAFETVREFLAGRIP